MPYLNHKVLMLLMGIGLVPTVTTARSVEGLKPRQPGPGAATPAYCITEHNVGRISLAVTNTATFGDGMHPGGNYDCFGSGLVQSCEFPKDSRTKYLFVGALWIGAVLGRDTLVSTGADGWGTNGYEFHPDDPPFGNMVYRSTIDPAMPEFDGAISEQDYVAVYADTCRSCLGVGTDLRDNRSHQPLNIEVTQRSFAWSYSYAQDFVLFDYAVRNIGIDRLRRVYMGVYVDADIYDLGMTGNEGYQDDFCGFREFQPALYMRAPCPVDSDIVNIAWTADNDGDMGQIVYKHVPHITATRIIRTPSDSLEVSFNWWVSNGDASLDFGPQARHSVRDFGTGGLGTPVGDRNKFHILRNGEFDYDQPRVATIGPLDSVWLQPPQGQVDDWADGLDTRYVLSFGPFDIEPGQTLPISLAYVGGAHFHSGSENLLNLPDNPESWYEAVNFDSLGSSATWAEWVYDNPGVDTDSDGYAGEFTICNLGGDSTYECETLWDSMADPPVQYDSCSWVYELPDTVWRKGDGVPDFRGAAPPPGPATYTVKDAHGVRHRGLRAEPATGKVRLVWNGVLAETTQDVFSREVDFEGYRVWIGRDDRPSSYSVVASYDIEDYNRWEWSDATNEFVLQESPFSLSELRCLYADSCGDTLWLPDNYVRSRPLIIPAGPGTDDQIYYFEPQDFNQSVLANDPVNATSPIRKVYPNAPRPPVYDTDSIRILFPNGADSLYLTDDGFIRYFEYEYTFENLLPTVSYWMNVTAFDYGSPKSDLKALETSPSLLPIVTYPQPSLSEIAEKGLEVIVYPNPYRLDGEYRPSGFEGRGRLEKPVDRTREIHFTNLPAKCVIRIYTLDGDLVREIIHDIDPVDPLANHDSWDLITRNSQLAVSGLYYWTVEDNDGDTQIGKFVIVM